MRNRFTALLLLCCALLSANWSEQRRDQLTGQAKQEQMNLLVARPSFHWPFDTSKKEAMRRLNQEKIPLFAYGSLLNEESAATTLGEETLATRRPAIAFGVNRRFDYDPGIDQGDERAMLNLATTGRTEDIVNGVVVEMSADDLMALSDRELGYDLVPVVVVDWNQAVGDGKPTFYTAYTFQAPSEGPYVNPDLLPDPGYYDLVVNGASQYGNEYLQLWYDTTFLGDGQTPVGKAAQKKRSQ
jgi:hypothetical protein